jgi:uncharacterized protein (TIGR03067 family)
VTIFKTNAVGAVALAALGLVAGAVPARANGVTALEGSWAVARATMNGAPRGDGKILNATWTFRGAELVVQSANGPRMRAALSFEANAQPPAFYLTPLDAAVERPLWMIWERQGDELRVAFYEGATGRPADFSPRRKLVVLTLVPAAAPPARAGLDPCAILRGAGADRLLGGPTQAQPAPRHAEAAGSTCSLVRTDGSSAVTLTLVAPPGGAGYFDAARSDVQGRQRMQLEEEPGLGDGAFWVVRGGAGSVVALRRGTAMILGFQVLGVDRAGLRGFAARVLDAL